MDLGIRLLGPVEVRRNGRPIAAGGPTQRAVLAMLAARAGQPVAIDDLVEGIWGEGDEPASGERSLWTHVSRLRGVLGNGSQPLTTVPGGYRLDPAAMTVDAHDFEQLLAVARRQRAAGDSRGAAATLQRALGLWGGPALMDLRNFPFAAPVAARYEEMHVGALEDWIETRLASGEDAGLIAELQELVAEHPYRERLRGQLMVALYRAGQQAAALDAYQAARGRLVKDLGVEPGPELGRLQREILQHADGLNPQLEESPEGLGRAATAVAGRELPAAPVLFGRDEQLAELERLAARARLLTLTGAGGSGKTALALALVHRLAPGFPDGAAVADLGAVAGAGQVLPAIAAALGVSERSSPLGEQLAAYLEEHRLLLVLDNVEHVLDAVGELDRLVGASGGLTVATSRSPLGIGLETVVEVPPLTLPDPADSREQALSRPAVQLFLHAAAVVGGRVERSGEEIESVARLCAAVDGLPLAIEIVAAQTRAEAPAELAAHLDERLPRLRSRQREAPARQQTMDAAIGWSIDRLPGEQQEQLSRLAVFSASFTARGASSVLGLGREETIELLTTLLDASLLTRWPTVAGQARFRMLQPVRAVARARLGASLLGESEAHHAAFFAAEVDRLCPRPTGIQQPADLAQLRADYPDLLAALGHLATTDPDRCIELADQLDDLWQWTGREAEARRLADDVLSCGRLSKRGTFLALGLSGWGAFLQGQPEEMRIKRDRMLALADEMGEEAITARARLREARFATMLGEGERARDAARAALEAARRAGDPRVVALALGTRSLAELDAPGGEAWAQEACDIADKQSMGFTQLWTLAAQSIVLDDHGRLAEAMRVERMVLDLAERFQALESVTVPVANLSSHLVQSGLIAEARRVLLPVLVTADRVGNRLYTTGAVAALGELEAARGRWLEALTLTTAARAAGERMGMTAAWTPQEHARLDRLERWMSELLGASVAAAARARARAMSYREMMDFALDLVPVLADGPSARVAAGEHTGAVRAAYQASAMNRGS